MCWTSQPEVHVFDYLVLSDLSCLRLTLGFLLELGAPDYLPHQ